MIRHIRVWWGECAAKSTKNLVWEFFEGQQFPSIRTQIPGPLPHSYELALLAQNANEHTGAGCP